MTNIEASSRVHMTDEGVRVCEAKTAESCPVTFSDGVTKAQHFNSLPDGLYGYVAHMEEEHGVSGLTNSVFSKKSQEVTNGVDSKPVSIPGFITDSKNPADRATLSSFIPD